MELPNIASIVQTIGNFPRRMGVTLYEVRYELAGTPDAVREHVLMLNRTIQTVTASLNERERSTFTSFSGSLRINEPHPLEPLLQPSPGQGEPIYEQFDIAFIKPETLLTIFAVRAGSGNLEFSAEYEPLQPEESSSAADDLDADGFDPAILFGERKDVTSVDIHSVFMPKSEEKPTIPREKALTPGEKALASIAMLLLTCRENLPAGTNISFKTGPVVNEFGLTIYYYQIDYDLPGSVSYSFSDSIHLNQAPNSQQFGVIA